MHASSKEYTRRKLYNFNGVKLYVPGNPKESLYRLYGSDCLTQCKTHNWDHNTSKPIKARNISCGNLPTPQL